MRFKDHEHPILRTYWINIILGWMNLFSYFILFTFKYNILKKLHIIIFFHDKHNILKETNSSNAHRMSLLEILGCTN